MKKFIYTAAASMLAAVMLPTTAEAQISVLKNGNAQFGTIGFKSSMGIGSAIQTRVVPDSTSNIVVLGPDNNNSGGRITFGDGAHVLIGEDKGDDILALKGDNGLNFRLGTTTYFQITKSAYIINDPVRAVFNCAVNAQSFNTTSDLRLKTDVAPLGETWRDLSELNSISYRLLPRPVPVEEGDEEMMEETTEAIPENRTRFGFAAQEVREIFPDLVSEDEEGYLSIDYLGFIPLLVDAYRNLEERNRELEERNNELEAKVEGILNPAKKTVSSADGILMESATLAQNRPNPFTDSTVIDITLPSEVADAMLYVYDMQGTQVMQLPVEGRGKTAVSIDGRTLRAGMYLYTLIADGEEVATKRMILTE